MLVITTGYTGYILVRPSSGYIRLVLSLNLFNFLSNAKPGTQETNSILDAFTLCVLFMLN